jgi:hypothetical protein
MKIINLNSKLRNRVILFSALFLIILYSSFFGEKITIGGGGGWDGTIYYNICSNFKEQLQNKILDPYTFQRVLPFAFINFNNRFTQARCKNIYS